MEFDGTRVEVVTIADLKAQSRGPNPHVQDDRHRLIRDFIERRDIQGSRVKLFIDEFPLYHKDLSATSF